MKYVGNKVSYIRHPFAKNSCWSLGLGIICLLLAGASMSLSVRSAGHGPLMTGALGFASMAAGLMGFWYSFLAFREKEKNYILAKIGTGICTAVTIFWLMVMVVGLR